MRFVELTSEIVAVESRLVKFYKCYFRKLRKGLHEKTLAL